MSRKHAQDYIMPTYAQFYRMRQYGWTILASRDAMAPAFLPPLSPITMAVRSAWSRPW